MSTTLTVKGQVTIPKPIRDAMGLTPGTSIDFAVNRNGEVVLHKADNGKATRKAWGAWARFANFSICWRIAKTTGSCPTPNCKAWTTTRNSTRSMPSSAALPTSSPKIFRWACWPKSLA